ISTWGTPKCNGARRFCKSEWNFLSMAKNSQWKNEGKLDEANCLPRRVGSAEQFRHRSALFHDLDGATVAGAVFVVGVDRQGFAERLEQVGNRHGTVGHFGA